MHTVRANAYAVMTPQTHCDEVLYADVSKGLEKASVEVSGPSSADIECPIEQGNNKPSYPAGEYPLALGLKNRILKSAANIPQKITKPADDSLVESLLNAIECPHGARLPDGCERISFVSDEGGIFSIAAKAFPGSDLSKRLAVNVKTGEPLEPLLVLKRTPCDGGFVWMRAEKTGLKGGDPSFYTIDDACANNGHAFVVALSSQGPFEVVDLHSNEQLGHFWASSTEEGDTVYVPSIENDSGVKGGTDITIWSIAKESNMANVKIGCAFNSNMREMLKDKYKMECDDVTLDCIGDRKTMLKAAKKRLKKNGWNLND